MVEEALRDPRNNKTLLGDYDGEPKRVKVDEYGHLQVSGFVPETYDYKEFGYTGDDITTILYKSGGSDGTLVATLTLEWTDGNIISITRT